VIMETEQKVLDFLEVFKCATTSQLTKLFYMTTKYPYNKSRRRLKILYDDKHIKRERNSINMEYVYFPKKNNQFNHSLILTEFYVQLQELAEIDKFEVEQPYGKIRPDGMCICGYKGFTHYFFIEVHISNNKFNQDKYISYYGSREWKQYFDVFPKVIIISDKKVELQQSPLKFIQIKQNCEDIKNIFRG
jgi:hypothetical protein